MPSLVTFRKRIASVKATRKITKANQMVAASKLRRAQEAAEAARPYAEKMGTVITGLASAAKANSGGPKLLAGTGKDDTHLVIVATADRGLCGGFNSNIVRLARQTIESLLREGKAVKILCVGRKGRDQLRRQYGAMILDTVDFMGIKRIGFADAAKIGARVLEMFEAGEFDVCTLVYSRFKSVISQVPTTQRLIPAPVEAAAEDNKGTVYDYEPDEAEILAELLPRNVSVQIFRALLENVAGEFGAKMSAMDSATRNAGEVIDRLTLEYNRTRQAMITKELIEIISGAEAL
ncbi:MAG: F0F1 ATP synthase subunit gamma [Alphaproteobacteria bacterium]|nr:F0F1 ATP synthase subunit gamma [Alphaproteobacteria bacterium]MDE2013084.1 F0F1 ATP synthase subunit gamma [Alphaproteobacteria bacterium]MDE2074696.1 F0F1 ATP synthase subunit gamma [Alphaproteobacteria bacterium]MDE2351319.1 F0F1 ATP synthase subunit gamma [Alphaproteobacteria bacterium]